MTQVVETVNDELFLTLDEEGAIHLIQRGAFYEGAYVPPSQVTTEFGELVEALDRARTSLTKEHGHDPFGGPEGGEVDSNSTKSGG